jgi:hypothetical protein
LGSKDDRDRIHTQAEDRSRVPGGGRPDAAELARLEEKIDGDRVESERLKEETRLIKARTAATLVRIEDYINQLAAAV